MSRQCALPNPLNTLRQQVKVPLAVEVQALKTQQVDVYLKRIKRSMAAVKSALKSNSVTEE
ncbi:MAG: hypothetical protein NVS4B11_10570 [Ktedonobacteraceae bacterium]